ncbi:MAG: methyltransferase domain-containing protein [Clostridia bacterium]|nr:methyltransferase domain-containing protein [Clostridia bacterium]
MKLKDLHDYDDVAENYDLYLEEMYSRGDNHAGFLDFYLDFAKEYGKDGVIDIACGTGAVLLHLAENGILADGTDLSEAMCRVADEKAKAKGFDLNIFHANMTAFKSDKTYSCAIIARSGFMHLLTPELQKAALLNIRENLSDGGMLTFNTFDPHPFIQAQQMQTKDTDYSFRLEYTNQQGKRERIYNAISYDPYTQIMSGNWKFETLNDKGEVIAERVRPLRMRQTYRQEMKYLLELTGYEIVNVYGGYHKESGEGSAKNVIWCVRKK